MVCSMFHRSRMVPQCEGWVCIQINSPISVCSLSLSCLVYKMGYHNKSSRNNNYSVRILRGLSGSLKRIARCIASSQQMTNITKTDKEKHECYIYESYVYHLRKSGEMPMETLKGKGNLSTLI